VHNLTIRLLQTSALHIQGDVGPYTTYTSKRRLLVAYAKAPPTKPPTYYQARLRNLWRAAAFSWKNLRTENKKAWTKAAKRAKLSITGYDLWMHYLTTGDEPAVRTVERLAHTRLL